VHSAVVRLVPGHHDHGMCTAPALLAQIVRQAFSQRRKTLRNALSGLASVALLDSLGVDARRRPETLTVAEFVRIADAAAPARPAAEA
jgi:16S rRNA (adenine1518-N6/adenine1519-N6)-dimethyltransferase